jgi:hypothetical protein
MMYYMACRLDKYSTMPAAHVMIRTILGQRQKVKKRLALPMINFPYAVPINCAANVFRLREAPPVDIIEW